MGLISWINKYLTTKNTSCEYIGKKDSLLVKGLTYWIIICYFFLVCPFHTANFSLRSDGLFICSHLFSCSPKFWYVILHHHLSWIRCRVILHHHLSWIQWREYLFFRQQSLNCSVDIVFVIMFDCWNRIY